MREIKIKLYAHENDSYVELYKVISGNTKQEYIARATCGGGDDGEWYFVADPLGYCELDHGCPKDYVFIICDPKGKELFRDSNGDIKNPFPTLERKAELSWQQIKSGYPCKKEGLDSWLLSYLTPEISATVLKDEPCHEHNWPHWYDQTYKEIISRFNHLGENYCIYKITNKHRYCDCIWSMYYSGYEEMGEYTGYVRYHGAMFDESKTGPNYGPGEATWLVKDVLEEIYKGWHSLSGIRIVREYVYEEKMNMRQAADFLLNRNYNRVFVNEVIKKEKAKPSFYKNYTELSKDYPDAVQDLSYRF